ncbi:putative galactose oxidase [Talaromyces proteolyticus]|uniref:Galactose oxidase n=1 Tax=Talaromyces proteolyticus TaxID=1131652 RepID=A0AAD4KZ60_9EURO|nr:putative galactose oxidase [Talaromyces proteolyticus]KAH8703298.1 putative galactose oxidase [Talaromyces proteolyticus]
MRPHTLLLGAFVLTTEALFHDGRQPTLANPYSDQIKFPLVPVAVAVVPTTKILVAWSSFKNDSFFVHGDDITQTAFYDPEACAVEHFTVSHLRHDMFCPSISLDFQGRIVVAGGDTEERTSVFDGQDWKPVSDMHIPRGYHSSTILSDGRIFTIGGSFSGGIGGKNGEVYDVNKDEWTLLSNASAETILTKDEGGLYRSDNHAWLFAWSNASVFQAGPSTRMNWFDINDNGTSTPAGIRNNDGDAMTGTVAMYDANKGKILSLGGAPSYNDSDATANAHLITIGKPGSQATVETLEPMHSTRTFANSVILPDGKVFVVGGQSHSVVFSDGNSSMIPEIWDPETKKFTEMAALPIPRNYHSSAILLPNATVFIGGGGLCPGECDTNHLNAHTFFPPYFYEADGVTLATRPIITSVGNSTVQVGGTLYATLSQPVASNEKLTWSMVRMGSSTHTVNTDQRRVYMSPQALTPTLFTLNLLSDPGVMLPGYWYLFALLNGVPSKAEIILVQP